MADTSRQASIADDGETQDTAAQSILSSFRILPNTPIDMSLLDQDLGPDPTEVHRNSWAVGKLQDYTVRDFSGEDLFALYCEDFNDWLNADFNSLSTSIANALRDFLYRKGIYTGKKRGSNAANQLYEVLTTEEDDPEWPEEALRRAQLDPGSVAFEMKQLLQQKMPFSDVQAMYGYGQPSTTTTSAQMTTSTTPINMSMAPTPVPAMPLDKGKSVQFEPAARHPTAILSSTDPSTDFSAPVRPTIESYNGHNTPPVQDTAQTRFPTSYQFRHPGNDHGFPLFSEDPVNTTFTDPRGNRITSVPPPEAIMTLPAFARNQLAPATMAESISLLPADTPNEPLDMHRATAFQKAWKEKDSYTGKMYDVLDDRVRDFISKCRIYGIGPSQYAHAFRWAVEGAARDYCRSSIPEDANFRTIYIMLKIHFDTEVNHSAYHNDFSGRTWESTKSEPENAGKAPMEILDVMLEKFRLCQRALGTRFAGEDHLVLAVTRAVRNSPEFDRATDEYHDSFQIFCSKLRTSLNRYHERASRTFLTQNHGWDPGTKHVPQTNPPPSTHFVDRKYNGNDFRSRQGNNTKRVGHSSVRKKRCWICGKEGHFSTQHSPDEQEQHKTDWRRQRHKAGRQYNATEYTQFLMEIEGEETLSDDDQFEDATEFSDSQYFAMTTTLADRAFTHLIVGEAPHPSTTTATQFLLDRYSNEIFQGIIPDTGAAENSTAGLEQYKALKREIPSLDLNQNEAGRVRITFGNGKPILSIGSVTVKTPIGTVEFHILDANTPFLLCLRDLDRLHVYLNNVTNELVNEATNTRVPVIRKWGHPWFFLAQEEASIAFLTETELRRLHKRFGHPSVTALHNLLQKAGHDDADHDVLAKIQKFCHYCQLNSKAPIRFKFTLRDDQEFNYRLIVDVMYLDSKPVLHVVDDATAFQAGRFLRSLSAADTWEALKACWIDTYLGPPDIIRHDPGTNFAAAEFRLEARHLGIACEQTPVEAHWAVGKVERYHAMIRRAYTIFKAELPSLAPESLLQMAFKAVNDTAGPNGLVPTLLVFGAYPRVNFDSPPSTLTVQRAAAVNKAMTELRKLAAQRKVNDALNTRNGPDVTKLSPLALELGSEVRVYREKGGWIGPYKVLSVAPGKVTVDMVNGPAEFATTHTQPYNRSPDAMPVPEGDLTTDTITVEYPEPVQPRRRGRPRRNAAQHLTGDTSNFDRHSAYMSTKESVDRELSLELRRQGKITTPGAPFEESDAVEIDGLMTAGVLKPELYKADTHSTIRIFKSRMVREVKNKNTDTPYEKSRLVVQGYGDDEKKSLLTQSPTIQRCSQRVILALAPTLTKLGMTLALRDISQAYVQSNSKLEREVIVHLPTELKEKYPEGTLLRIMKPLYGIAEAGLHWYATYQQHHQEKLHMTATAYDPCLLVTAEGGAFGVAGLQTDDTLLLGTEQFLDLEEEELRKAKFRAKPRTPLGPGSTGDFNGCRLTFGNDGTILVIQKGQADRIEPAKDAAQYVEQRARGAYISSVCQPEAAFDFSVAAQAVEPSKADYKQLNERLQWQIDNKIRGLRFIPLDLSKSKLIVFADGSFANNKDMSSQIGFVICLATEEPTAEGFTITGNILHWQSSKCKRVTRSVLASEIYGLVNGFDLAYVIGETLRTVTQRLNLPPIPLVVCTDSYSLYDCLVKLGTTTEKRLMIDLQALRQSYERREISEIRWISGEGNPADSMTKGKANRALEKLIDNNELTVKLEAWVDRKTDKGKGQETEEPACN